MGRARRSAASVAEAATEAEAEHEPEAAPEANGQDADAGSADSASPTPPAPLKKRGRARQPPQPKAEEEGAAEGEDDEDDDDDDEEYEVEQILDSKKVKGKLHFLIRWKGYQPESDTWEPESTLNCPDLIEKFKESQTNGKKKKIGPKRSKKEFDYENADENAEYEVDKILEVHHKKNGSREFLIHWKGWAASHDTWEPEDNLCCPELMKRFMSKVKAKQIASPRDLRVAPKITKRFTLTSKDSGRRLSKRSNNRQRVRYDDAE